MDEETSLQELLDQFTDTVEDLNNTTSEIQTIANTSMQSATTVLNQVAEVRALIDGWVAVVTSADSVPSEDSSYLAALTTITGGTNWLGMKSDASITHTLVTTPPSYPEGMTVAFEVGSTIAKDTAVTLNLDGLGVWPIYTMAMQPARGADLAKGAVISVKKNGSAWVIDTPSRLPSDFIQAPVPTWTSTTSITVDGAAVMRDQSNTADIVLTDAVRAINLSTANSLNGRAEGTAIANSSGYHLYAVARDDFSAAGWVLALDPAATSFTLGGDLYSHVRRVPLSVMTTAAGAIQNFTIPSWSGSSAKVRYLVAFNNAVGTNPTQVINTSATTTFFNVSVSNFVPSTASHVDLYLYGASTTGEIADYSTTFVYGWGGFGRGGQTLEGVPLDAGRDFQARFVAAGIPGSAGISACVSGYSITL
jgi:hypothetical protein